MLSLENLVLQKLTALEKQSIMLFFSKGDKDDLGSDLIRSIFSKKLLMLKIGYPIFSFLGNNFSIFLV